MRLDRSEASRLWPEGPDTALHVLPRGIPLGCLLRLVSKPSAHNSIPPISRHRPYRAMLRISSNSEEAMDITRAEAW
jgi:hypothetical protein